MSEENLFPSQDRLDEKYREWRESRRSLRKAEFSFLEEELAIDFDEQENTWQRYKSKFEAERLRRLNIEWQWKLERRQRELIRWEREDLEWEWKLQRRERYNAGASQNNGTAKLNRHERPSEGIKTKRNRQHKKRSLRRKTGVKES